eukprot:Hpha_TRINITY_DN18480_c0_g1::TRINITY_DN18480_c0_g1_i1::g.165499::m.165499
MAGEEDTGFDCLSVDPLQRWCIPTPPPQPPKSKLYKKRRKGPNPSPSPPYPSRPRPCNQTAVRDLFLSGGPRPSDVDSPERSKRDTSGTSEDSGFALLKQDIQEERRVERRHKRLVASLRMAMEKGAVARRRLPVAREELAVVEQRVEKGERRLEAAQVVNGQLEASIQRFLQEVGQLRDRADQVTQQIEVLRKTRMEPFEQHRRHLWATWGNERTVWIERKERFSQLRGHTEVKKRQRALIESAQKALLTGGTGIRQRYLKKLDLYRTRRQRLRRLDKQGTTLAVKTLKVLFRRYYMRLKTWAITSNRNRRLLKAAEAVCRGSEFGLLKMYWDKLGSLVELAAEMRRRNAFASVMSRTTDIGRMRTAYNALRRVATLARLRRAAVELAKTSGENLGRMYLAKLLGLLRHRAVERHIESRAIAMLAATAKGLMRVYFARLRKLASNRVKRMTRAKHAYALLRWHETMLRVTCWTRLEVNALMGMCRKLQKKIGLSAPRSAEILEEEQSLRDPIVEEEETRRSLRHRQMARVLRAYGKTGSIGFMVTKDSDGGIERVVVKNVLSNGPAAEAGLQEGDVVVGVHLPQGGYSQVNTTEDFILLVGPHNGVFEGTAIDIKIIRTAGVYANAAKHQSRALRKGAQKGSRRIGKDKAASAYNPPMTVRVVVGPLSENARQFRKRELFKTLSHEWPFLNVDLLFNLIHDPIACRAEVRESFIACDKEMEMPQPTSKSEGPRTNKSECDPPETSREQTSRRSIAGGPWHNTMLSTDGVRLLFSTYAKRLCISVPPYSLWPNPIEDLAIYDEFQLRFSFEDVFPYIREVFMAHLSSVNSDVGA